MNKSTLTYLILILYLTISLPICFSEENTDGTHEKTTSKSFSESLEFSIGAGLGYLSGQYREIVYTNASSKTPYLSELLWNLDNIFLLNFDAGVSAGPWKLEMSIGTAVTKGTGEMEDYDWGDYSKTDWTNWSSSLIFLDSSVFLDIGLSYRYTLNKFFFFPIKLGYKLNYLDWEDESKKYIYYWDFEVNEYYDQVQTGNFNGVNGIDYEVIQNIFYISSGVHFTMGQLSAGLNLAISPFIYTWDLDHHILREIYFLDTFIANFWYKTELSFKLKTSPKGEIRLTVFREELPEVRGDIYQYNEDSLDPEKMGQQTGYYKESAGLASILWGVELSYTWTF